ncbi:hypothetical protein ACDT12_13330, partial [Staphylococcus aureus]
MKGEADVDLPDADLNVSAEAPDVDIKAPKGSGGFHIGMPKFGVKGKDFKGEVELPEADRSGGFNINMPKLPSFGISGKGPKVEGGIDADVNLPKADVNVELPEADINVKAPKAKGGFNIGFPKFGKGKSAKG